MSRVIVVGLGPIGVSCAHAVRTDAQLELVGLVDSDPAKAGMALEDLDQQPCRCQPNLSEEELSLRVKTTLDEVAGARPEVAIVATASRLPAAMGTIKACLVAGMSVVSSCEELSWPWYRHDALARELDATAKAARRTLLGTGVNPGFAMDSLAIVLATAVRKVRKVRCVRQLDAALRRQPLQQKVGATMSVEKFNELKAQGKMGHVGIAESVAMVAAGLGRQVAPGSVVESLEPVVASKAMRCGLGLIEPGRVAGMRNTAQWSGPDLEIELDLTMAVGVEDAADRIELEGPVSVRLEIPGALPGDSATVAVLINETRQINKVAPGLKTMLDMPPAGCRG
ncbi:MAG: hypothetical protein IT442_09765 [Phycisphaeraceae bacterium]|nr:hypothetical protein [Phycisphaeraceae bacterium]